MSIDEIRQNDYNLNIPRYVDSSESAESWDVYSTMFGGIPKQDIDALGKYWNVFPDCANVSLLRGTPFGQSSPCKTFVRR